MSTKISHNSKLLLEPAFVILECQWEPSGRDLWGSDIHTPLILGYCDWWSHWVKRSCCLIFSLRESRGINSVKTRHLRIDGKCSKRHGFSSIFRVIHSLRLSSPSSASHPNHVQVVGRTSLGSHINVYLSTSRIYLATIFCCWDQRNSKPATAVLHTRVIKYLI